MIKASDDHKKFEKNLKKFLTSETECGKITKPLNGQTGKRTTVYLEN